MLKDVRILINDVIAENVSIFHRDFKRRLNREIYDNINNE